MAKKLLQSRTEKLISFVECGLLYSARFSLSPSYIRDFFALDLRDLELQKKFTDELIHTSFDYENKQIIFTRSGKVVGHNADCLKRETLDFIRTLAPTPSKANEQLSLKDAIHFSKFCKPQAELIIDQAKHLSSDLVMAALQAFQVTGDHNLARQLYLAYPPSFSLSSQYPSLMALAWVRGNDLGWTPANLSLHLFRDIEGGKRRNQPGAPHSPYVISLYERVMLITKLYRLWLKVLLGQLRYLRDSWQDVVEWLECVTHWELSSQVLSAYWHGPTQSNREAEKMLDHGLRSKNFAIQIRTLDWCLFVLAHGTTVPGTLLLYKSLWGIAKKRSPFLLTDIMLHNSILHYYAGNLTAALLGQSHIEESLYCGSHNFNRLVNLSNLMRSALVLNIPEITNIVYLKSRQIPGYQQGHLFHRTQLTFLIQQMDVVGGNAEVQTAFSSIDKDVESLPALQKASTQMMFAIAFYKTGNQTEARRRLDKARRDLEISGLIVPYAKALESLERMTAGNSRKRFSIFSNNGWRCLDAQKHRLILKSTLRRVRDRLLASSNKERSDFLASILARDSLKKEELGAAFIEWLDFAFPTLSVRIFQADGEVLKNFLYEPSKILGLFEREGRSIHLRTDFLDFEYRVEHQQQGYDWLVIVAVVTDPHVKSVFHKIRFCLPFATNSDITSTLNTLLDKTCDFCAAYRNIVLHERKVNLVQEIETSKHHKEIAMIAKQVAHDIRSPLSALNIFVASLGEIATEKRSLVKNSIQRINEIADDLLRRSRPEMRALAAPLGQRHVVNIRSPILDIVSEKQIQFRDLEQVHFEIVTELRCDTYIDVDRPAFMRTLSNLLNNAVEALDEHRGKVLIHLQELGDNARICIEDNGRGIPPELLPSLGCPGTSFGRRVHGKGSGLGLFYAKNTIESLGGSFKIYSQLGRGTQVEIILPKANFVVGTLAASSAFETSLPS